MNDLKQFLESLTLPMGMAMLGGAAKTALTGWKSWRHFLAGQFVSGFAGLTLCLFIYDAGFSTALQGGLGGMAGYSGVVAINALETLFKKILENLTGNKITPEKWDGVDRRKGGK